MSETPESVVGDGGKGGDSALLTTEFQELADTKLISRAIREQWDIPIARRPVIVERLIGIVEKTEVATPCGESGLLHLECPADKNAIAAARVLVSMVGQNIGENDKTPTVVNNGTIINGDPIFLPAEQRRVMLVSIMGHAPEESNPPAENRVVESTAHPSGNGTATGADAADARKVLPASPVAKANGHAGNGSH